MMKGLEALENIIETFYDKDSEEIQIVRKELKVLEIIKNKLLKISEFETLEVRDNIDLTQEECELLEEVLRDEN